MSHSPFLRKGVAPKEDTTHYDLRVAIAPSASAVTDSLDFRGAVASLQIQFPSATHVRCARRQATEDRGVD